MTLSADKFKDYMNLKADDERTEKYLHGETISVEPGETASPSGWKLVCVDGFGLGWGKLVNGTLKNKYPVGWRSRKIMPVFAGKTSKYYKVINRN